MLKTTCSGCGKTFRFQDADAGCIIAGKQISDFWWPRCCNEWLGASQCHHALHCTRFIWEQNGRMALLPNDSTDKIISCLFSHLSTHCNGTHWFCCSVRLFVFDYTFWPVDVAEDQVQRQLFQGRKKIQLVGHHHSSSESPSTPGTLGTLCTLGTLVHFFILG